MPDAELPQGDDITAERAADLVARYPRDPRAHLYRGIAFITAGHDLADAEEQFRRAIDPNDVAAAGLSPDFIKAGTALLAITLAYERRPDEARALGTPLCGYAEKNLDAYFATMQRIGICPAA
jgi:rhomboid protease GluP